MSFIYDGLQFSKSCKERQEKGLEINYEIRLESIGGLGANLCGKMLGELGVKYLNLNSMNFSSYGSEKTGTPVKGYIRYCDKDKEIRDHSSVVKPNLLVIFHQALLQDDTVWKGCSKKTDVIISGGEENREEVRSILEQKCKEGRLSGFRNIYMVSGQKIAIETKSRINVVMLGAIAKVIEETMGFMKLSDVEQICRDALGKKYPEALSGNLEGVRSGYEAIRREAWAAGKTEENTVEKRERNSKTDVMKWGYRTAPIGGINPDFGSTVISDLSPSRQGYIPLFIKERCINCGLCDSTCPDMVFQFKRGEYKGREMMVNQGLDYYHCKGCLRCVEVCPVNALVRGTEAEHPQKEYFMPNQELLRNPDYYLKTGADGYITSEAFLDEKREEGGEV